MHHALTLSPCPSEDPDDLALYEHLYVAPEGAYSGRPTFQPPEGYEPRGPAWLVAIAPDPDGGDLLLYLWARVFRLTAEERERREQAFRDALRKEEAERRRLLEVTACAWLRAQGVPVESFDALHELYQRDLLAHARRIGASRHRTTKDWLIRAIMERAMEATKVTP